MTLKDLQLNVPLIGWDWFFMLLITLGEDMCMQVLHLGFQPVCFILLTNFFVMLAETKIYFKFEFLYLMSTSSGLRCWS